MLRPASPLLLLILFACTLDTPDPHALRSEIESVEAAFAASVAEHGIHQGFLEFAADDAILIRNSRATEGKAAIGTRFAQSSDAGQKLTWSPRKIEVARSGELAYSFGDFVFISLDSIGQADTLNGNFCTIWKKQTDGTWKYVVD
jgi:ketosteroid isomerase-like protein